MSAVELVRAGVRALLGKRRGARAASARVLGLVARLVGAGMLAAGGALAAGVGAPAGAQGSSSVESAWWNLAEAGPLSVPSTTPSGELQVSYGLSGPLAFAAVRYVLPSSLNGQPLDPASAQVVLTLAFAPNSTVGTPDVAACPTTSPWSPGPDQPASKAPGYNCGQGMEAEGTVSADGSSESWSLGPSEQAPGHPGVYEVALVPAPGTSLPFSADFMAPTAQSVAVTPAIPPPTVPPVGASQAGSAPASSTGTPVASSGAPAAAGNTAPSAVSLPAPGALSLSLPSSTYGSSTTGSLPAVGALASPTPAPAPTSRGSGASGGERLALAAPAANHGTSGGLGSRAKRYLAVSILLATGAALFLFGGRPARGPRLLGSLASRAGPGGKEASVRMGGIGRFQRPRTGPPPRL